MPVLDARALDIDPKGMAFLRSVLRPVPLKIPPAKTPTMARVHFHFRMIRRVKELATDSV